MQDIRLRLEEPQALLMPLMSSSTTTTNGITTAAHAQSPAARLFGRRPMQLPSQLTQHSYQNEQSAPEEIQHGPTNVQQFPAHEEQWQVPQSPSSEEDNSPTELNNCRRLIDKPPLVKRLTMGIGLLRTTEECRPLVHTNTKSTTASYAPTITDGYVNEAICEPEESMISSKFGDSCRQSLTAIEATQRLQERSTPAADFGCWKNYLRETCSANSSPKMYAPTAPLRCGGVSGIGTLSLYEQQELKGAAWFQAGIPREISLEVLARQSPGAFLVRQSSTKPGCFALSLRVPPPAPKVAHYLILPTPRGYKIKGFTKEFSSLRALITHHSVMPELLPVPLTLPRPMQLGGPLAARNGAIRAPHVANSSDFETYGSLNEFRKMMADQLNV